AAGPGLLQPGNHAPGAAGAIRRVRAVIGRRRGKEMSFDWKSWIARIDDMNLRERAMLFGSVALVVVVTAQGTLVDRALGNRKRLTERVTRDQSQLKSVRDQLQLIVK